MKTSLLLFILASIFYPVTLFAASPLFDSVIKSRNEIDRKAFQNLSPSAARSLAMDILSTLNQGLTEYQKGSQNPPSLSLEALTPLLRRAGFRFVQVPVQYDKFKHAWHDLMKMPAGTPPDFLKILNSISAQYYVQWPEAEPLPMTIGPSLDSHEKRIVVFEFLSDVNLSKVDHSEYDVMSFSQLVIRIEEVGHLAQFLLAWAGQPPLISKFFQSEDVQNDFHHFLQNPHNLTPNILGQGAYWREWVESDVFAFLREGFGRELANQAAAYKSRRFVMERSTVVKKKTPFSFCSKLLFGK